MYWLLLVLPYALLIAAVEYESGLSATIISFLTAAAVAMFFPPILHWIYAHPFDLLLYVAGYIVIGVAWIFIKWHFYIMNCRDRYREAVEKFNLNWAQFKSLHSGGLVVPNLTVSDKLTFEDYCEARRNYTKTSPKDPRDQLVPGFYEYLPKVDEYLPKVSENKGRILFWGSYWIASSVWTIINDPLRRLFSLILRRISAMMQNMANKAFDGDSNN